MWLVLILGGGRGGGLREGVYEIVIVEVEGGGGVVVADRRHDGYVAVVGGVVGAGYTSQQTVVLEPIGRVEALWVTGLMVVVGRELGLLLAESGGTLGLLGGG